MFYLHRQQDGQDIYFLVNSTYLAQKAQVRLAGSVQPMRWDPSTGTERIIAPSFVKDNRTCFDLDLPPVGSVFILVQPAFGPRIIDTNLNIDFMDETYWAGFGRGDEQYVVIEKEGQEEHISIQGTEPTPPLELEGEWEFEPGNENALVIGKWLATDETREAERQAYARPDADTSGWLPMVPGAWSYQLPAEPEHEYPIPVWYRIPFSILPASQGHNARGWFCRLGMVTICQRQTDQGRPERSQMDAQMKAVDITKFLQQGDNLIALRIVVTNATDGLLDLLKLTGHFSLVPHGSGSYRMAAPRNSLPLPPGRLKAIPISLAGPYTAGF